MNTATLHFLIFVDTERLLPINVLVE